MGNAPIWRRSGVALWAGQGYHHVLFDNRGAAAAQSAMTSCWWKHKPGRIRACHNPPDGPVLCGHTGHLEGSLRAWNCGLCCRTASGRISICRANPMRKRSARRQDGDLAKKPSNELATTSAMIASYPVIFNLQSSSWGRRNAIGRPAAGTSS